MTDKTKTYSNGTVVANMKVPHLQRCLEELEACMAQDPDKPIGMRGDFVRELLTYGLRTQSLAYVEDLMACPACNVMEKVSTATWPAISGDEFNCPKCGVLMGRVTERALHELCHENRKAVHDVSEEIASEMTARFSVAHNSAVALIELLEEWENMQRRMHAQRAPTLDWWRRFDALRQAVKNNLNTMKGN